MGNINRKATRDEMAHAYSVIRKAFPDMEPVFGGHSAYGGHRAPRDHTISFRLRDQFVLALVRERLHAGPASATFRVA